MSVIQRKIMKVMMNTGMCKFRSLQLLERSDGKAVEDFDIWGVPWSDARGKLDLCAIGRT